MYQMQSSRYVKTKERVRKVIGQYYNKQLDDYNNQILNAYVIQQKNRVKIPFINWEQQYIGHKDYFEKLVTQLTNILLQQKKPLQPQSSEQGISTDIQQDQEQQDQKQQEEQQIVEQIKEELKKLGFDDESIDLYGDQISDMSTQITESQQQMKQEFIDKVQAKNMIQIQKALSNQQEIREKLQKDIKQIMDNSTTKSQFLTNLSKIFKNTTEYQLLFTQKSIKDKYDQLKAGNFDVNDLEYNKQANTVNSMTIKQSTK